MLTPPPGSPQSLLTPPGGYSTSLLSAQPGDFPGAGDPSPLSLSALDYPVLDQYETAEDTMGIIKSDLTAANSSLAEHKRIREDYVEKRLRPLYMEIAGDFADDGLDEAEMLSALEAGREEDTLLSGEEPGCFGGVSDASQISADRLKTVWPKYDRVKQGLDRAVKSHQAAENTRNSRAMAHDDATMNFQRLPIALRQALDDQVKLRAKLSPSITQETLL